MEHSTAARQYGSAAEPAPTREESSERRQGAGRSASGRVWDVWCEELLPPSNPCAARPLMDAVEDRAERQKLCDQRKRSVPPDTQPVQLDDVWVLYFAPKGHFVAEGFEYCTVRALHRRGLCEQLDCDRNDAATGVRCGPRLSLHEPARRAASVPLRPEDLREPTLAYEDTDL